MSQGALLQTDPRSARNRRTCVMKRGEKNEEDNHAIHLSGSLRRDERTNFFTGQF